MKRILIITLALSALMLASCGEGIKKRPLNNSSKEVLHKGIAVGNSKSVFQQYDIKFWDDLNFKTYPTPTMSGNRFATASVPNANLAQSRLHAAYRMGTAFSTDDKARISQRPMLIRITVPEVDVDSSVVMQENAERFFVKCVNAADRSKEYGISAVMVGGYFYGYLATVLESTNPETKLPDERAVQLAMQKLGNLKEMLNVAINSEKDVQNIVVVKKLKDVADDLMESYNDASNRPAEKYSEMLGKVRDIDGYFEQ